MLFPGTFFIFSANTFVFIVLYKNRLNIVFLLVPAVTWFFFFSQLGQEGKVPLKSARLFFDLSEKVRKVLESYFRLDTPLYFTYSHLVCRSAIDGKLTTDSASFFPHPDFVSRSWFRHDSQMTSFIC